MFEKLYRKDDYTVEAALSKKCLTLRVTIQNHHKVSVYEASLGSVKDGDRLQENFDDLEGLLEYIRESSHIQINIEKLILSVIGRIEGKKPKIVEMGKIKLKLIENLFVNQNEKELIQQIYSKCKEYQQLSCWDLKGMIGCIAGQLIRLLEQQQQKKYKKSDHFQDDALREMKQKLLDDKMENYIKSTKKQMQNLKKQLIEKINTQIQFNQHEFDKIFDQNQRFVKFAKEYQQREESFRKQLQSLNERIGELRQEIRQQIYKINGILDTQRKFEVGRMQEKVEKVKNSNINSKAKIQQIQPQQKLTLVDPSCRDFKKLIIDDSKITAFSTCRIFLRPKIGSKFSFHIKIHKINSTIGIGIADENQKYNQQLGKNKIIYYNDAYCYILSNLSQRSRYFKQKQKMTITVNLNSGVVMWKVEDDLRCKVKCSQLTQPGVVWVPYVCMNDGGQVEILE